MRHSQNNMVVRDLIMGTELNNQVPQAPSKTQTEEVKIPDSEKVFEIVKEKDLVIITEDDELTEEIVKVKKSDDGYVLGIYTYPKNGYSYRITLANIPIKDLKDGKRIPANKILKSFQEHRETLLKKAYEIETQIDQMQYVKAYIEQTKEKLEKYCRSFNTDIRDIYGIPYCVRLD